MKIVSVRLNTFGTGSERNGRTFLLNHCGIFISEGLRSILRESVFEEASLLVPVTECNEVFTSLVLGYLIIRLDIES